MDKEDPVRILVIDDSDSDRELFQIAFDEQGLKNPLDLAANGPAGLEILRGNAGTKQIVLLDLNLPGMTGQDVLAEIRGDPALSAIPVIVFSSSDHPEDIARSYRGGANAFLRKPLNLDTLAREIESIDRFWLQIVEYA